MPQDACPAHSSADYYLRPVFAPGQPLPGLHESGTNSSHDLYFNLSPIQTLFAHLLTWADYLGSLLESAFFEFQITWPVLFKMGSMFHVDVKNHQLPVGPGMASSVYLCIWFPRLLGFIRYIFPVLAVSGVADLPITGGDQEGISVDLFLLFFELG